MLFNRSVQIFKSDYEKMSLRLAEDRVKEESFLQHVKNFQPTLREIETLNSNSDVVVYVPNNLQNLSIPTRSFMEQNFSTVFRFNNNRHLNNLEGSNVIIPDRIDEACKNLHFPETYITNFKDMPKVFMTHCYTVVEKITLVGDNSNIRLSRELYETWYKDLVIHIYPGMQKIAAELHLDINLPIVKRVCFENAVSVWHFKYAGHLNDLRDLIKLL